jgi:8-amino-7-oxononanoate synthase
MRRLEQSFLTTVKYDQKSAGSTDFCTNDILGLGSSNRLRREYGIELTRYPEHPLGAANSRIIGGGYDYLDMVEKEIAAFHGADTGIILSSGYDANIIIMQSLIRPGDAIVYDELVHASSVDGIRQSPAIASHSFSHNDVAELRNILSTIQEEQSLIRQGKRCILVAVESIYSMDGDICPLREMIEVADEMFPNGNCQFIVDEAHSTGIVGPQGRGLVSELGLQSKVAIRLHTFGKALGSQGGMLNTMMQIYFRSEH